MKEGTHWWMVLAFVLLAASTAAAQPLITDNRTATQLAQNITGQGVVISGAQLTCPAVANGIFKDANAYIGLDSGILLTTGRALTSGSAFGANGSASANANVNNNAPGDAQLDVLANNTTLDACILEFDVVPRGDTLRFNYVFASEEYNNATCGPYNDAFAFYISGPGIAGQQNIALVPGTSIPVTVNSINNGIPGTQGDIANCTSIGAGSPFTQYYVDNTGAAAYTYKGYTTVLQALSQVTPCATYHLRLSVADAGNALYDSGVFIRAGSLQASAYAVTAQGATPQAGAVVVRGCAPGAFIVSTSHPSAAAQTVHYTLSGPAINGTDYAALADSVVIPAGALYATIAIQALEAAPGGASGINIYILAPFNCAGAQVADSATLLITDAPPAQILTPDTTVCRGSVLSVAALTAPGLVYSWGPAAGFDHPDFAAALLTAAVPGTSAYVLTVTLPGAGCPPKTDTLLVSTTGPPTVDAGADITTCPHASILLNGAVGAGSATGLSFLWQGPSGDVATTLQAGIPDAGAGATGTYVLTATSQNCPPASDAVTVTALPALSAPPVNGPLYACTGGDIPAFFAADKTYRFYTTPTGGAVQAAPTLPATGAPGTATLYFAEVVNGCESPRTRLDIVVEACCSPHLFVPTAFTPNGDGHNDVLRITKDHATEIDFFQVFNRFGQVVYDGKNSAPWGGAYNGYPADAGTYYYRAALHCNGRKTVLKGEVQLLR